MTLHYSILTTSTNQAKTLSLVDGQIVKASFANAVSGRFTAHSVETLQEFGEVLNKITVKQSLIIGSVVRLDGTVLAVGEKIGLCLKGKATDKSVSRSKDHIKNLNVAGFMLFDVDGNSGTLSDFVAFIPEFAGIGAVIKPSSSSLIYDKNGNELVGEKGRHIYIPVNNMADVPRIADILWARQWIAGHGYHLISAGVHPALLERGLFDLSVIGKSERLAFEAKPILNDGLIQKYNHSVVYDGNILDTSTIKDLTPDEINAAKQAIKESALKVRPEFEKVTETKKKEFIATGKTQKDWESLGRGELSPDYKVLTVNGIMRVGELNKSHDGLTMADPNDPEYDGGSLTKAKFYWNDGKPKINSQAHGGCIYKILKKTIATIDCDQGNGCYCLNVPLDEYLFVDVVRDEKGRITTIMPTKSNLQILLNSYGISAIYDEAIKSQQIIIDARHTISHDLHNEACLQQIYDLVALNRINSSVVDRLPIILAENTINPVKDWINLSKWDGKDRINELCNSLIVPVDDRKLSNEIIKTWLIQCIAALDKGVIGCRINSQARAKYELVLVLQADQGHKKTTWFTKLLPDKVNGQNFSNRYIKDGSNLSLDSKDSIKQNISCWINELGELDATFRKSDIAALKAFCSNQRDIIRLPYARTECGFLRSTSFCASVNDEQFLNDSTGSRRFGVIKVHAINEHDIDMQQLWAQVRDLYVGGARWWLDKDIETEMQKRNEAHTAIVPIEDAILSKFEWDDKPTMWTNRMTFTDVYQSCFDKKPNKMDLNTIKPFLIKLGVSIIKPKNVQTALMPSFKNAYRDDYGD